MTTRYRNLSTHVPIRIWTMPSPERPGEDMFRIEMPSADLTTPTEWKFDTKISSIAGWRLYRLAPSGQSEFYVLNTAVLPPFPKGCLFMNLTHNDAPPYNTTAVLVTDFINTSREQFCVFTYSVPNTLPLYVWMSLDMYNELTTQMYINPDTDNVAQRRAIMSQYISYTIYPFLSVEPFWRGTHEFLCIPCSANDPHRKKFATLNECQEKTYPRIKNRHTWVENGNQPLKKFMQWWEGLPSDRKVRSLLFS